jgi:hypothetical protein
MGVMRIIRGQPSWRIASDRREAFVTQLGADRAQFWASMPALYQ